MSLVFAAVLIVVGLVSAVAIVVAVPVLFGLMAYDVVESRKNTVPTPKDAPLRIAVERGVARAFVLLGAAFWGVSALAASLWYQRGMEALLFIALIPFLMNIGSLIIGWRFERVASLMLAVTSAGAVWWAAAHSFELGVWMLFVLLLIGPMSTAAVLFWLARQGELDLAAHLVPAELAKVRDEA